MIPRALLLAILPALFLVPAMAQQQPAQPPTAAAKPKPVAPKPPVAKPEAAKPAAPKPGGPKAIGTFDDWIAATHQEAGQPVCYAFTRAQTSIPTLPGRGGVVLTVTQRNSGRDAVAIEAGFPFAPNATVEVQADQSGLDFYTAQRAAFARNGHAAVVAFQSSSRAIARSPGPHDVKLTDTFSLKGFSAAYAAISKACPPK
jgi:hypothetical protein